MLRRLLGRCVLLILATVHMVQTIQTVITTSLISSLETLETSGEIADKEISALLLLLLTQRETKFEDSTEM